MTNWMDYEPGNNWKGVCLAGGETNPTYVCSGWSGKSAGKKHSDVDAVAQILRLGSSQKFSSEKHILWQHF